MQHEITQPLSIRIEIKSSCRLTMTNTNKVLTVNSDLSLIQLQSVREGLNKDLEQFRQILASPHQTLRNSANALRILHRGGVKILNKLFGNTSELLEAQDMCRNACPNWERSGWDPDSIAPHVIDVRSSVEHGIPVEILPLLNPITPDQVDNLQDLSRLAGSFLGFSAIVRRNSYSSLHNTDQLRLHNIPKLPIKMFWSADLPHAKASVDFFRKNNEHIDLDGPWPDSRASTNTDNFCKRLAQFLYNPDASFNGQARQKSDQIYYFFCHCDTSALCPDYHYLFLKCPGILGKERKVSVEELNFELRQLDLIHAGNKTLRKWKNQNTRPLVFINACGSANLNPTGYSSFPKLFLSETFGYMGFIGTEATIPEAFAGIFSEAFYKYLLSGLPLGLALYAARWNVFKIYKNPLGILYSSYANPSIQVRRPVRDFFPEFRRPKTDV